jgi:hypothetical protein
LAGSRTTGLPAPWRNNDYIGAQVFKLALNQFASACTDRDHGSHGGNTDDDSEDRQTGSHLVFAERCNRDA